MKTSEVQQKGARQPAMQQHKGTASLESPQGEQIAQLETMADTSPQTARLAQLAAVANDNNPVATAQRKAAADIHSSPHATAQRRQLDKTTGVTVQSVETPTKPNNTGLPDNLKSGIESLSGLSMDNVRVHYNSSQPAQLNAHAYAQGTNIHIAPGQEQHLPHEAWHVVQQAQGRVQPTMQMKNNVPINDDHSLEHEADIMGKHAAGWANIETNSSAPIAQQLPMTVAQCKPAWVNRKGTEMDKYVNTLDEKVNEYAKVIIENPLVKPLDGYLKRWVGLAHSFANKFKEEKSISTVKGAEPFVYAAYGYAVESLTNHSRDQLDSSLPEGHSAGYQVTRGNTRPDIVVKNMNGKDVGWFDITASNSEMHINAKSGHGWKKNDYVAEVTYPSLTDEILIAICVNMLKNIGGTVNENTLDELYRANLENKKIYEEKISIAAKLVNSSITDLGDESNQSTRRKKFEENLGFLINNSEKLLPATAKGIIGISFGHEYASIARRAGYHGDNLNGRNSEAARELIAGIILSDQEK